MHHLSLHKQDLVTACCRLRVLYHAIQTRLDKDGVVDVQLLPSFLSLLARSRWSQHSLHYAAGRQATAAATAVAGGAGAGAVATASAVHHSIGCSRCGTSPIVGVRYRSTRVAGYNLCGSCVRITDTQASGPFEEVKGKGCNLQSPVQYKVMRASRSLCWPPY